MKKLVSDGGGGNVVLHVPMNHVDGHGKVIPENGFCIAETQKIVRLRELLRKEGRMALHGLIGRLSIGKTVSQGLMKHLFVGWGEGKGSGIQERLRFQGLRAESKDMGAHGSQKMDAIGREPVGTLQHRKHRK